MDNWEMCEYPKYLVHLQIFDKNLSFYILEHSNDKVS